MKISEHCIGTILIVTVIAVSVDLSCNKCDVLGEATLIYVFFFHNKQADENSHCIALFTQNSKNNKSHLK